MKGEAQGILAVATSIADGQDVDWPAIEASLRSEEERALVRSLRVIASIGELHRSTDPEPDGDPSSDPRSDGDGHSQGSAGLLGAGRLSGDRVRVRRGRIVGRIGPPGAEAGAGPPGVETQAPGEADATLEPPLAETGEHVPPPSASTRSNPSRTAAATPGAPSGSGGAEPPAPERWGSLVVRERVGAGVFGEVYRAYDEQLQREVALKLLRVGSRSSDRLAEKVLNEGRLLARLRHPNVVLVHGVEARGDRVGLWMEFVKGCTLEQLLDRQGLFGAREAALIGQDLCRAIAAVHAAGLVHRDVKAQNVMREEGGRVVLMDFGTGVPVREDDSGRGAPAAGTPLYLAPELLEGGEATASSDLYSLGVLLYHLVTGGYPVVAASLGELKEAHQRGRRRLHDARPDLPDAFVQAIDRALAPNPADRHASAGAMQEALTRALGIDTPTSQSNAQAFDPIRSADPMLPSGLLSSTGNVAVPTPPAAVQTTSRTRRWLLIAGLFALIAAGIGGYLTQSFWRTPAPGPINSVVVLPLANVSSADRDLADGINVLVAEQLATLPSLRVVHYTESMASRDKGMPVSEIIRRVQADGAISGSVNWTGSRAHVFVQLIRAGSSTPAWVKQFEVPARRAAELPRSVARDVAGALGIKLSAADELALSGQDSSAPEAFEAYLRARVLMRAATVPSTKQAIVQLQDALRLDPSHAPSYAALARCYIIESVAQGQRPLAEAGPLAREAAERALQLDNQLAEAHQALAEVKFYVDWDWDGANEEFRRAVESRPNSGDLRSTYAMFLASRKRLPDAMQEVHQAVALDPMSPLANASLGMLWHYARSDDQAERIYRGVLEADPSFMPARLGLIRTYLATRRFDLALRELERNRSDARGELSTGQQSQMALAYIGLGRAAEAVKIADSLVQQEGDLPSVDAASVFLALNQRDRALDIIERAVDLKLPKVLFLRLDPRFDALLNEPRYRVLLQRMGFPS
jgi:eukaryotic-like serine/threonine-protein kinase